MGSKERLSLAAVDDDIGHWLANVRAHQGLTQKQVASRAGTAQSAISRMENGAVSPTLNTIRRVTESMGLQLYLAVSER